VLQSFEGALVRSLSREALLSALAASVEGLLRESTEVEELAEKTAPRLRELLVIGSRDEPTIAQDVDESLESDR
jgi:hypothetical protein